MFINKIILFALVLILAFSLSGCSEVLNLFGIKEPRISAQERFDLIISALETKNVEALKAMFSKKALDEAVELDSGIEYVMNFYNGNLISSDYAFDTTKKNRYGVKEIEIKALYFVTTSTDKFILFFIETTVNDNSPEEVGLYMLQIIKESDRETQFDWGNKTKCAGVYRPNE